MVRKTKHSVGFLIVFMIAFSFLICSDECMSEGKDMNDVIDEFNLQQTVQGGPNYVIKAVYNRNSYKNAMNSVEIKNSLETELAEKLDSRKSIKPEIKLKGTKSFQGDDGNSRISTMQINVDVNDDGVIDGLDTKEWINLMDLYDLNSDGVVDAGDISGFRDKILEISNVRGNIKNAIYQYAESEDKDSKYTELREYDLNGDNKINDDDLFFAMNPYKKYDHDADNDITIKDLGPINAQILLVKSISEMAGVANISSFKDYSDEINKGISGYDYDFNESIDEAFEPDLYLADVFMDFNSENNLYDDFSKIEFLTGPVFLSVNLEENTMREVFTMNGYSWIREETLDNILLSDIIDILANKKNKTDIENAVVKAAEVIEEIRDYLDEKTQDAVEEVVKLVIIAYTMKNMLKGVDFDVVNTALTNMAKECRKVYDEYMNLSESAYKELAGILGIDLEKDALPDEYIHLAKIPISERVRILVDYAVEKIEAKGKDISKHESNAITFYKNRIVKLNENYQQKFKAVVEGFIFAVKKALMNAAPAVKSEDKKKFEAVFNLGALQE